MTTKWPSVVSCGTSVAIDLTRDGRVICGFLGRRLVSGSNGRVADIAAEFFGVFDQLGDLVRGVLRPGVDRRRLPVDRVCFDCIV